MLKACATWNDQKRHCRDELRILSSTVGKIWVSGEIENSRFLSHTPIFISLYIMWTVMLLIHLLMNLSSVVCTS